MQMEYLENWDIIKKRMTLLWENEILDRPVVSVKAPNEKKNAYSMKNSYEGRSLKDYYNDPEWMLERCLADIDRTYFAGDAMPILFPNWGCGGHSKYLESWEQFETHTEYLPHTIWMRPLIEEYEDFNLNFDMQNPVFQDELRKMKYFAEKGKGKFFVAMPDNCGSYDALGNLRHNDNILYDFIDQPEAVRAAANKMVDTLIQSGDAMFEAVRDNCDGGSVHSWMGTWSPGKHMQLQCDLSVMISPQMYKDFIVEELERTTQWLDHATYHLDGIEQTRHLDLILSVKKLNMIQWTEVSGQPPVTENFHHIQRIQKAGKGIVMIIGKEKLDAVLNNVSPYGRILVVGSAKNQQEGDDIVDYVAKHSFQKRFY